MVGVEDYCAVLDCVAGICAVRTDDSEAALRATHHRVTEARRRTKNNKLLFSVSPCLRGEMNLDGTQQQTRAGGWPRQVRSGVRAFPEGTWGASHGVRH